LSLSMSHRHSAIHFLSRSLAVSALALTVAVVPLAAQEAPPSDTSSALPFRGGQWATQFGFDGNFVSAGALRFRSPRSAWVIDASGHVATRTYERGGGDFGPAVSVDATDYAAGLQLGLRRYRAVATRVNAFGGAGIFGRIQTARSLFLGTLTELPTQRDGMTGLYGELGATWMVSRNLGLSGATQLAASYVWSSAEQPSAFGGAPRMETHGYSLDLARARLLVSVFF
jgi:hypothetical protein